MVGNVRDDIINAASPLQTCAGLKSGIEASIQAMKKICEEDSTEAILLVDAENAFNNLNCKAALHNIKQLCPIFHQYLANSYQLPARQHPRDVAAMAMYTTGTKPLSDTLRSATDQHG